MLTWLDRFALLVATTMLLSCAESVHQARRLQSSGTFATDNVSSTAQGSALDLFGEVRTAPDRYRDRTVTWAGAVLNARRLSDRTEVEILHLPSNEEGRPTENRRLSQGRFLAYRGEFLDPATLVPGTRVTITGRLEGATTRPLDSGADDYTYPMLAIVDLHTWPVSSAGAAPAALDAAGTAVESPSILGSLVQGLLAALVNTLFSRGSDASAAPPSSASSSTPARSDSSPARPLPPQFQKGR